MNETERMMAIVGGMVFDGTGRAPISDGVVLTRGTRILGVGHRSEIPIPREVQEIDISGSFVLPGLINAHDHLSWDVVADEDITDTQALLGLPEAYLSLKAARNGANHLLSGVTTIRNMGDVRYADLQYRRAFAEGLLPGPRLLASGPWIATTHAWITFPGIPTCDGPQEVRKFVRANLRAGVDHIKVFVGGELLGQCNTDPHLTYIAKDELAIAIEESHAKRKPIGAHIMSSRSPGFSWAVELGIDAIEHGIWFTQDDFAHMKAKGIPIVLAGGRWFEGDLCLSAYPDPQGILRQWYERVLASGVAYAIGVDGWGDIGAMQLEIERLAKYGFSNRDALVAATKTGAIVCGLGHMLGTLKPGMLADVLVVDGNPLVEIRDLRNVRLVMKEGKICAMRGEDDRIRLVR